MLLFASSAATAAPKSVPKWGLFEASFDPGIKAANPFDPAQVDVTATFISPGGKSIIVPAFAYKAFSREIIDGAEKLTPAAPDSDSYVWMVRFTPAQTGKWKWRWTAKSAAGTKTGAWSGFSVIAPARGSHGFLRVSNKDNRYLSFDDGAPWFAIGENLGWYDARGTAAYDAWLEHLAASGCNFIRVWFATWGFALEWTGPGAKGAGDYSARMDRAWQLDYVIRKAASLGIYVMLCIQNHGPFSYITNSEWAANPYSAVNGGPLAEASEFFTAPVAKDLFKRRLRYIVARWGYSPNVMSWELWNEVSAAERKSTGDVAAWHAEMARYLKAIDPNRHLVTTSVVNNLKAPEFANALWPLKDIDFTQIHKYAAYPMDLYDFTKEIPLYAGFLRKFGKPVLAAEVGVDYRGAAETLKYDPQSSGFHDFLWMGIFAETFGTGMTWWWDSLIDPKNMYGEFRPVAEFVRGVDFPAEAFKTGGAEVTGATKRPVAAYALRGRSAALIWLKDSRYIWFTKRGPVTIRGASVTIKGLRKGKWRYEWLDAYTGGIVEKGEAAVKGGGAVTLSAPVFSKDIALKMRCKK